ncbi:MAG: type II/IV secretion system protein, partial [Elusimicrobia bacterium]|nr:type II/IV secretion system protein [Elusimicrobiota bacterium]
GALLVSEGFVKEDQLLEFVARQCGLERIDLARLPAIPDEALLTVPKALARKHMLIPVDKTPERLTVAIADPLNVMILDDLKIIAGCEVTATLASERDIVAAQDKFYRQLRKSAKAARAKSPEAPADAGDVIALDLPRRLANTLVERGTLTQAQLEEALDIRKQSQRKLGSILVSKGYIGPEKLLEFVAQECGLACISMSSIAEISRDVTALVPKKLARQHTLIPFNKTGQTLMVAISDPLNVLVLDELKLLTGCDVKAVLAPAAEIKAAITAHYEKKAESAWAQAAPEEPEEEPEEEAQEAGPEESEEAWELPADAAWAEAEAPAETAEKDGEVDYEEAESRLGQMVEQAREMAASVASTDVELQDEKVDVSEVDPGTPEVQKIVNAVIMNALTMKASDIHIEPFEDPAGRHSRVRVRYRVDGVLRRGKLSVIPWMYRSAVMIKIKILTETMNITERRIPQTGHIHIMARNHPIEFRVEMIPTVYGESCVLRVMDRREMLVDVNKLGFLPDMHEKFLGLFKGIGGKKNFGLVLVCGPSGSGKSTTLYAALNHIKRPDIKIWTAENPVEYNIMGVVQVSVNPDIKLGEGKHFNFASSLRSFLRLDPDVIMVGEIRDEETAEIAMEAAMTGHLVLATLHTTDAPSSVSRLVGMGLPGYLIADTLKAVLAQRLSRRLCADCREEYDPPPEEAEVFKANRVALPPGTKLYRAKGCPKCMMSGFRGRLGMYELMVVGDHVREACHKDVSASNVCQAAMQDGMHLLIQDSLEKAKAGLTSLQEVLGKTGEISVD